MRFEYVAFYDGQCADGIVNAADQDAAELAALIEIAKEFRLVAYEEDLRAELDGFKVSRPGPIRLYRQLADGLSDMIEEGRLTESDIPDDYRWLVELLANIAADDPTGAEMPASIAAIRSEHGKG